MNGAWDPTTIASIVEGDGEVAALPKLLHRIAADLDVPNLLTPTPMRIPRGKITIAGGIERAVAAEALRVPGKGGVLVVLDADDDCPAEYGPLLLARAKAARPDKQVSVVLANREFEAWFLAAAPSLAGQFGFPDKFPRPQNSEAPRDCKGLLTEVQLDSRVGGVVGRAQQGSLADAVKQGVVQSTAEPVASVPRRHDQFHELAVTSDPLVGHAAR